MKKLLLLLLFTTSVAAQGIPHTNVALGVYKVSGVGYVAVAIPTPLITVCTGSTVPLLGTTCTGTANIFSNLSLTNALSNPFNGDAGGALRVHQESGEISQPGRCHQPDATPDCLPRRFIRHTAVGILWRERQQRYRLSGRTRYRCGGQTGD